MRALVLSLLVIFSFVSLAYPIGHGPSSTTDTSGNRYRICFTATSTVPNSTFTLSTTKCLFITIVGTCTVQTADVNIDGSIGIDDLSIIALHYHENNTGPEPYNPLNTPQVGLEDLSCVALYYHQTDPLP